MIGVTGGLGFIGSQLARALVTGGHEVMVIDTLLDRTRLNKLSDARVVDVIDEGALLKLLAGRDPAIRDLDLILHQGAITDTLATDARRVLEANYGYSKRLLRMCQHYRVRLIYASSAAVYGLNTTCRESPEYEQPLSVYGHSKLLFDRLVRTQLASAQRQIVGLRYFNVYGPGEEHKGSMASLVLQLYKQVLSSGKVAIFGRSGRYGAGEQRRDFVCLEDVMAVNGFFISNPSMSGIYNVGTGLSRTFNDLARQVLAFHGSGQLEYIPFPPQLEATYQTSTQADLRALRRAGCGIEFTSLEVGVPRYLALLRDSL